jgi:hypothetical protein
LGEVESSGSYLSQSDLRLHFGLGSIAHVDKAEIEWPDGKREVLANLAAEHFYKIREGAGVVEARPPVAGTPSTPGVPNRPPKGPN